MPMIITQEGEKGCCKIISAVISNTLAIIERPSMISGNLQIMNRIDREKQWLNDIIDWAYTKENFILNQFEAIFDYDRKKVANAIADKALRKLLEYDGEN